MCVSLSDKLNLLTILSLGHHFFFDFLGQFSYIKPFITGMYPSFFQFAERQKVIQNSGKVMDIIDYDPEIMHIFSRDVLKKITSGEDGWQEMLPEGVADTIIENKLFTGGVLAEKIE